MLGWQLEKEGFIGKSTFVYNRVERQFHHLIISQFPRLVISLFHHLVISLFRERENLIEHPLQIPGDAVKTVVYSINGFSFDMLLSFLEKTSSKVGIHISINSFQCFYGGALVERTGMAQEHFRHHIALRSGKDETGIMAVLDVGAQYGFHISFSIAADGLEFINGHDARLICAL